MQKLESEIFLPAGLTSPGDRTYGGGGVDADCHPPLPALWMRQVRVAMLAAAAGDDGVAMVMMMCSSCWFQLYCAQWLGQERIVCGGCFTNMARVVDRASLNVRLFFCIGPKQSFDGLWSSDLVGDVRSRDFFSVSRPVCRGLG